MADYQVTCIRRDGADPDRRIDCLGGPQFGPADIDQVISAIDQGHRFWVAGNPSAWLEKKLSSRGRWYVRTVPDGLYDNNLYALRECP